MYKRLIFLISVGTMASLFWFWVKPWIENPLRLSTDYNIWIKPLVALVILAALESLALLMVNQRYWRWGITLAASVPYFMVFGLDGLHWTVVPIAVLLQMYGGHEIHSEASSRIKMNIRQIINGGLHSIIISVLIMISFAFYLNPATQLTARQQQLPPGAKTLIAKTVSTFLSGRVENLPPDQRAGVLNQVTGEVLNQFNGFLRPYFKYFPPILAFGLYLILQGLSPIMVWLSTLVVLFIFAALKKSGVIRIEKVQIETEKMILS